MQGIQLPRVTLKTSLLFGTAIAGLAGGIYAHRMGHICSSDFAFVISKALKVANRGYVLKTGKIVLSDTTENLRGNDVVQNAYLGA